MKNLKNKWITKDPTTRLYHLPVPLIGLTGGIGTGKSTVAQLLREKGLAIIDADKLVKAIYQRPETIAFIARQFPHVMIGDSIDFKKLRETAFLDPVAKKCIEDNIYASLPDEFMKAYTTFNNPPFVVYDVPLLFEKKLNDKVDLSICVYAPRDVQISRIVLRDQSSPLLAAQMLDNQMSIEEKKKISDLVIDNSAKPGELKKVVEQLLSEITT